MGVVAPADQLPFGTPVEPADLAPMMLPLVARDQMFAPSMLLRLYRADPAGTRRTLLEGLDAPYFGDRITIAWIMSATGDRHFRRPLVALLKAPVRALRLAAAAGLERIADPHTRAALEWASVDPDYEVREFAARALRALPRP